ncbi:possible Adenylate cyclase [Prochlorococcus marinus str. MIT 9515]|uniref:Possible Adenylate cyclase n=1 Tax=Prochlorococcus marinus (strain MIT 9515) TaxID=167542 RepID=A2BW75_PROM5|nr:possible Adenylate cyclase [Prochlorococcus marinus str. MIT 9515]
MKIQLDRAEVKKDILLKNIYKEYEIYFRIVRKSILSSTEKGIFGLYSDLSLRNSDKEYKNLELINFLNNDISFLIQSKLPLLTIEQLKLIDNSETQIHLINKKALKELLKLKKSKTVNFDYETELITKESIEFNCSNKLNSYQYYESINDDEFSSVNLDENDCLNYYSKQPSIKDLEDEKHIIDSVLELIEGTKEKNIINPKNFNDQENDVSLYSDNLNLFEKVDKGFNQFLVDLSYKVNSELFKIKLIQKNISEDIFKFLSNNHNLIKHPHPFVISYDLNPSNFTEFNNKSGNISLFNISDIELEFHNLELSICRNNINELKNKFRLLNKKHLYWKNKELYLKNLK